MIRENLTCGHVEFAEYDRLVRSVFGVEAAPPWPALAMFDGAQRCVAGLQRALLSLRLDGEPVPFAAIRNVAVAEDWRGMGLMSALFARQLARGEAQATRSLLYAETPALYARYGFAPLAQHTFEGPAPAPQGPPTARRIEASRDRALVDRLLSARTPVSGLVAVLDDSGLTAHALHRSDRSLFYDETLDAALLIEADGGILVLVDVIAPVMPSAARVLGALGARSERLRTLFPPDLLGWTGAPIVEDAGLMIRGVVPDALRRPFMLPPTVEF